MAFQGPRSEDIRATLAVSQEEARLGGSRVINLPGGRSANVVVPAGIRDGQELRLPGQGMVGEAGSMAGDLVLRIAVVRADRERAEADDAFATQAAQYPPLAPAQPDYARGGNGNAVPPAVYPPTFYSSPPTEVSSNNYASQPPVYPSSQEPRAYQAFNAPAQYPASPDRMSQPRPFASPQAIPTYQPLQTPSPRRRGGAVTTTIVVVLLLVLVGSGLFFYLGYYQPGQQRTGGTATANAQVQATAHAQATSTVQITQATAQAAATATAQVQATAQAYQGLYTQATSGTPALNDSLSSQTSHQWDTTIGASGSCTFTGGSYRSSIPTAGFFQPCYAENTNFGNFAFQVDMTIVQGDEGGMIFRANNVDDKFYLFKINYSGNYELYLYVDNQGSDAKQLLNGSTDLMHPTGQSNEITVVAQDGNLTFYVNQHYLANKTDTTYNAGIIGVFAESTASATEVTFSHAKVWQL